MTSIRNTIEILACNSECIGSLNGMCGCNCSVVGIYSHYDVITLTNKIPRA